MLEVLASSKKMLGNFPSLFQQNQKPDVHMFAFMRCNSYSILTIDKNVQLL